MTVSASSTIQFHVASDPAGAEGGGDEATLAAVQLSFGHEQAIAQDRAQYAQQELALLEVLGVGDQDVPDRFGGADHDGWFGA
jgi:hypothetical protein